MANNKSGYARQLFSPSEIRFVKDNYINMTYSHMGEVLNRNKQTVWNMAKSLGIKKGKAQVYNTNR